MRWNSHVYAPTRPENASQVPQPCRIVLDMLDHVEQAGGAERAGDEARRFECRLRDGPDTARIGLLRALRPGLDNHRVKSRRSESQ